MKYKYNGQWLTIPTGGGGGTTVIANPTLAGTEDNLIGIQIDDDKFKVDVNSTIVNSGMHIHTDGFDSPDYDRILTTITTQGASYTATEDCWLIGYIRQNTITAAQVYVDEVLIAPSMICDYNQSPINNYATLIPIFVQVKKDSIITTRTNHGLYDLKVYANKSETNIESQLATDAHVENNQDTPVGTIVSFFGTTAPAHYLACDGSVYNISAYPDLAEFIKNEFGSYNYFSGDGTTTFGVPDLRGEFLRGTGTNSHANQGSGANVGAHQDATLLPDIFTDNNNITASGKVENQDWRGTAYSSGDVYKYTNATTYSNTKYRSTTRPTNTSVLWCIKAEATYYLVNQIENATIATLDKYSTDEKCIGCWTNGKPLYRKVIISTSGDTAHTWKVIENLINVDFAYIVGGYLKTVDGSRFELNSIRYNNNYSNLDYVTTQISGNNNVAIMTSSNYLNKEVICIIEYTKTTDAPNSFSIDMLSNVQDLVLTAAEVQATIDAIVV